ncbi:MAG: M23 family metallopeptidase [Myxococcota bacterium]|nr:M23 family metallopeptidase [Myxococcota bacterium]
MIRFGLVFATLSSWAWTAQGMPLDYPLKYPPQVTSTFGTYRITHHHAGLDLTTDGNETIPVVASAGGKIVRVRRSHTGYGRAVYIDHGLGRMTVYAHLSGFGPRIRRIVAASRKSASKFQFDRYLSKPLPVERGQLLGWVGTSGTDLVHLHYELRLNGRPVNPLNHGLTIPDSMPPVIRRLRFRPLNHRAHVGGSHQDFEWWVRPQHTVSVPVGGEVGLLVDAVDRIDGSERRLTPYQIELYVDDVLRHRTRYETTDYQHRGHTELDYDAALKASGVGVFYRLFRVPGPKLPVHQPVGMTLDRFGPGMHHARLKVLDAAGLRDEISFRFEVRDAQTSCQLQPGRLKKPDTAPRPVRVPLVRRNVYVPVADGACASGSLASVYLNGRRTRQWSVRTVDEMPHLVIEVSPVKTQTVTVGFKASSGRVHWSSTQIYAGYQDQEIALDPMTFRFGSKTRFEPYAMSIRAVIKPEVTGLIPKSPLYELNNGWAPARGAAQVRFRLPADADPQRVGLFLHDAGRWWYLSQTERRGEFLGRSVHMTGFALMKDEQAPIILPWAVQAHPAGRRIVIPIQEDGSGVRRAQLFVDDRLVAAEWQRAFSRLVYLPLTDQLRGGRKLTVKAVDRMGNSVERTMRFCWPTTEEECKNE